MELKLGLPELNISTCNKVEVVVIDTQTGGVLEAF